jgi:hypothetical protein
MVGRWGPKKSMFLAPFGMRCVNGVGAQEKQVLRSADSAGMTNVWLVVAQMYGLGCATANGPLQKAGPAEVRARPASEPQRVRIICGRWLELRRRGRYACGLP